MKRLGKIFIYFILIVAIVIGVAAAYFFFEIEKVPGFTKREIVKISPFSSKGSLDEWEEKLLVRKRTEYNITEYEGEPCVKAVSEDSASTLFYKERLFYNRNPFLSWDWKAEEFPLRKHKETLNDKEEFDFAAQVYVVFHSRFFLNAKAIQYVWTKDLPVGTTSNSPYTKKVKMLVLQSGPSGEWKHEERNIKDDFKALFGQELKKDVAAVSLMTDADSTDTRAIAYYRDITIGYLEFDPEKKEKNRKWKKLKWFLAERSKQSGT